jgi:hypothetical protein
MTNRTIWMAGLVLGMLAACGSESPDASLDTGMEEDVRTDSGDAGEEPLSSAVTAACEAIASGPTEVTASGGGALSNQPEVTAGVAYRIDDANVGIGGHVYFVTDTEQSFVFLFSEPHDFQLYRGVNEEGVMGSFRPPEKTLDIDTCDALNAGYVEEDVAPGNQLIITADAPPSVDMYFVPLEL